MITWELSQATAEGQLDVPIPLVLRPFRSYDNGTSRLFSAPPRAVTRT